MTQENAVKLLEQLVKGAELFAPVFAQLISGLVEAAGTPGAELAKRLDAALGAMRADVRQLHQDLADSDAAARAELGPIAPVSVNRK